MNRLIKFRVWDKSRKELTYDSWNVVFNDLVQISIHGIDMDNPQEGDFEIQQFTGLKDKNSKDIYEGDILKGQTYVYSQDLKINEPIGIEDTFMACGYDVTGARFSLNFIPLNNQRGGWDFHEGMSNRIEVIGNIFENPDLLNKNENK